MNVVSKLCALSAIALSLAQPTTLQAAPLKSTKVMKDLVRQCEYVDGVIMRVLAPRECPVLEAATPTPSSPPPAATITSAQPVSIQQAAQTVNASQPTAKASDDIILEKAIGRCTNIGFKRDTAEFRSCVTEQITLLSK